MIDQHHISKVFINNFGFFKFLIAIFRWSIYLDKLSSIENSSLQYFVQLKKLNPFFLNIFY